MSGLQINTDVYEGTVKIGIAEVTGDNLALNGICGFIESFIRHQLSRNCKMHIDEMRRATTSNAQLSRSYVNYCDDLDLNNPMSTGINDPCLLNNVEHVHVSTNYVPDIMHDLLEGV
ncbi:Hypothetical predicted protein [Paramuricea clavata]|uniref:Uncharacterized protein n=1 Tax=Paramuricea clavata TaxID=317549 RepID=A0A7D9DUQ9_PARCT|nr:Hypothetical predicted protein [Paramuricea clavata]